MKKEIRDHIATSHIGITGANAITAEEGSIILVHNEGNIAEVIRKEKHIIISAIDKEYPTIEDAINMIKIITYNATGATVPSFIEIMSGVSKTADVEKKFFTGVHSPREVVLILLDNKRTEIIEKGFLLNCFSVLIAGTVSSIVLCITRLGITSQKRKTWEARDLPVTAFQMENPTRNLSSVLPAGSVKKAVPYQSISRQSSEISGVRVSRKRPIIF